MFSSVIHLVAAVSMSAVLLVLHLASLSLIHPIMCCFLFVARFAQCKM